jgi:hypothetical protein
LTATPAAGYVFTNWIENGAVVSTSAIYSFIVSGSRTLVANFSESHQLIISNGITSPYEYLPSYSGSRYSVSEQIYTAEELGDAGSITSIGFYNEGAETTRWYDIYLRHTTRTGFSDTTGYWEPVNYPYSTAFSGSVTMRANDWTVITISPFDYDGISNVLLVVNDKTGVETPMSQMMSCRVFNTNKDQSVIMYSMNNIVLDDPNCSAFCPPMPMKNELLVAKEVSTSTFNVLVFSNPRDGGTVSGEGNYSQGQTCTVTAIANEGYQFLNWRENGVAVHNNASYSFTVTGNRILVAQFVPSGPGGLTDDNIVFADDNVKTLCVANWDTDGDGELSSAEAAAVTTLEQVFSNDRSISSFDELQYFIGLTFIDSYSFYYCTGLTTIKIPNSVISINRSAFSGCSGLTSMTVLADNPPTLGSFVFDSVDRSIPVYVPCGSLEVYQNATGWNAFTNIQESCSQTHTITLSQDWNWFSTYLEIEDSLELLQMLQTALGENGQQIKNSDVSTEYDPEWGWFGDLEEVGITVGELVMIKTVDTCTIQLQGPMSNPTNHPITINPGWNWIGYPCAEEMTLEEVFSNFTPEDGDKIKNSEGTSEYDAEWGWFGDVETLVPGQGFMYYSASTVPKTLVFQVGRKK